MYFAIPVIIGLVATPKTSSDSATLWTGTVIWVTHFLVFWASCYLALLMLSRLPFRWISGKPQLFLLAAIVGVSAARPVFWARYHLQADYLMAVGSGADAVGLPFVIFQPSFEFVSMMARMYLPSAIAWTFFTVIADRYFDLLPQRAGSLPARSRGETAAVDATPPGLADVPGIAATMAGRIMWMKAEGHYTLMVKDDGRELVYQRFGDAVRQLASVGTQVHRSFWVRYDHLASSETRFEDGMLTLRDGAKVPVGPSYVAKVKEALAHKHPGHAPSGGPAPTAFHDA
jgi:hypothetical protein